MIPTALAQRLSASAVILQGPALVQVARLARRGLEATRRQDGYAAPPAVLALLDLLDDGAAAHLQAIPAPPAPPAAARPLWEPLVECTTAEVAGLLGISERHVRRIAPELGGVRRGSAYVFERAEVDLELERRRSTSGGGRTDVRRSTDSAA